MEDFAKAREFSLPLRRPQATAASIRAANQIRLSGV
jgi:hypothetical protein